MNYFLVAIGAAIGGTLRYFLSSSFQTQTPDSFPWTTLAINIAGSFLLGLIMQLAADRNIIGENLKVFLTIGFCGGFTTFSTFSFETISLFQSGEMLRGLLYIGASNVLSILAAFGGYSIGKNF